MTHKQHAETCREAALKRCASNCRSLARILDILHHEPKETPKRMPKARVLLSEITKDLHESNAFYNQTIV